MVNILIGVIFSFVLTIILLPIFIRLADANKLYVSSNYRKIHTNNVSALGGMALFLASILSFILFSDIQQVLDYRYIIGSTFLIFALGLRDDLYEINHIIKLLGQIVSVSLLVVFADVKIDFFQSYFEDIGLFLDIFLTIFLMILIINAYNLIDGVDLLAAVIGFLVLGVLGIWFLIVLQYDYSLILLSLSASLMAFTIFNYSPAKIFMGDTGTMTIGLIMSIGIVNFNIVNSEIVGDYSFNNPIAISFSLTALIVCDLFRVAITRLLKKQSPFRPDRNHIHHLLLKLNIPHNKISFIIGLVIVTQVFFTVLLDKTISSDLVLIVLNILFISVFYAVIFKLLGKKN